MINTVKGWFDHSQNNARDYLNIISADFVQKSQIVEAAIAMNKPLD